MHSNEQPPLGMGCWSLNTGFGRSQIIVLLSYMYNICNTVQAQETPKSLKTEMNWVLVSEEQKFF